MASVLIVDDDPSIIDLLQMYLQKAEHEVLTAGDGRQCMKVMRENRPDLVLLDIMLPEMDGYEVCQNIRQQYDTPIIFVTARDDEADPIVGLEMGADDYVTKPFNPREVVARVEAVLRRHRRPEERDDRPVTLGDFRINPATREAHVNSREVSLTPLEFEIVLLLARHPKIVFSKQQIMHRVWGEDADYGDYRTVDTHIRRARKKLQDAGMEECVIETVWGTGYRFICENQDGSD